MLKEKVENQPETNQWFDEMVSKKTSSAFFIKNLINSYFKELGERRARPNRVALELSNSKVLVWAEIENDDELTEDALILSAAKVNYAFSTFGFHISSTIVEVDDKLNVPKHYKEVFLKEIQRVLT
jgi:hypothetical protein